MSPLPFELALALRYLRPKRTFVSVITLICILGVMLGVSVLIVVISVMTGFSNEFRDRIIGFNAHLKVEPRQAAMTNWPALLAEIARDPAVRSVAPYIDTQVLIRSEPADGTPSRTFGAVLHGVHPQWETNVSRLLQNVVEGEARLTPRSLLVGASLADNYALRVGDRLAVYAPAAFEQLEAALERAKQAGNKELDELPLATDFKLRGLFDLGLNELNANLLIASLADAQELGGLGDAAQGLAVMLHDPSEQNTARVRTELLARLGEGYRSASWASENSAFTNALATEKAMMFFILFFIVLVASFSIMSALITFVVQKKAEIGILKALGAGARQVTIIFLCQSLILGVFGVATGCALGVLAVSYRNEFLRFMSERVGFDLFPPSIYYLTGGIPAQIVPRDMAIICFGSLLICVLAGIVPALRAAWLRPMEALRHE